MVTTPVGLVMVRVLSSSVLDSNHSWVKSTRITGICTCPLGTLHSGEQANTV